MNRQTTKIILSIIAIIITVALIALAVIAALSASKYKWNNKVDIYIPQDVTLKFEGTAGQNSFVASALAGEFVDGDGNLNAHWAIPDSETTFSEQKQTVTITFKFTNECSSRLSITIRGILFDSQNRFTTYLTDIGGNLISSEDITYEADNTGTYVMYLEGGLDQVTQINLNYTLVETTVPISGIEQDKQTIQIVIDKAE